jgi:hypothetical protein
MFITINHTPNYFPVRNQFNNFHCYKGFLIFGKAIRKYKYDRLDMFTVNCFIKQFVIDNPEGFKAFRSDFHSFISNRNIYTHGQLHFFRPSLEYVIQYLAKPGQTPAYVIINSETLISYNDFYKVLQQFLTDFHTAFNSRKKGP